MQARSRPAGDPALRIAKLITLELRRIGQRIFANVALAAPALIFRRSLGDFLLSLGLPQVSRAIQIGPILGVPRFLSRVESGSTLLEHVCKAKSPDRERDRDTRGAGVVDRKFARERMTCSPVCPRSSVSPVDVVVHCGRGCKFVWGEPVEARVPSVQVVVDPPFFDDVAGVTMAAEQMLVDGRRPQ